MLAAEFVQNVAMGGAIGDFKGPVHGFALFGVEYDYGDGYKRLSFNWRGHDLGTTAVVCFGGCLVRKFDSRVTAEKSGELSGSAKADRKVSAK